MLDIKLDTSLNAKLKHTAEFCFARGHELFTVGKYDDANAEYQKGLAADPESFMGWTGLADVFWVVESWAQAERCYRHALKLKPGFPPACIGLAETLTHSGKPAESIKILDELGDVPEQPADVSVAYGNAYIALDKFRLASKHFRRAVRLAPRDAACWRDLAITEELRGNFQAGLEHYEMAVQVSLNNPDGWFSRFTVGCAYLLRGYFEHGWTCYEYRKHNPVWSDHQMYKTLPQWEGQDVNGNILLYEEQGLGDFIQFLRYIPLTAAKCRHLIVDARPEHRALLSFMQLPENVLIKGETAVPFDCVCPMLSQPFMHKRWEPLQTDGPYLRVPALGSWKWDASPTVALTWFGNPHHKNDRRRSIPLPLLMPLVESRPDINWVTLSPEPRAQEEIDKLKAPIQQVRLETLDAVAAATSACDLVISVDTAHLHLAGALGRPTWGLIPYAPDWRWGLKSDTTPWYPSLKLFRQSTPTGQFNGVPWNSWKEVLGRVEKELSSWTPDPNAS